MSWLLLAAEHTTEIGTGVAGTVLAVGLGVRALLRKRKTHRMTRTEQLLADAVAEHREYARNHPFTRDLAVNSVLFRYKAKLAAAKLPVPADARAQVEGALG